MGTRSFSSAKNFGLVGAMFVGTECCIEGVSLYQPLKSCERFADLDINAVSCKERSQKRNCCWLPHRRDTCEQSRAAGSGSGVRGLCGFQRCNRLLHEITLRQLRVSRIYFAISAENLGST